MSNESKLPVHRTFPAEFKREAVELIRKQGLSAAGGRVWSVLAKARKIER